MALLIDGYNLMNIVGILGRGVGPGSLERSRLALLNFLVESLESKEIAGTTVVFDAVNAPPGLLRVVRHRGLTVRFASQYPDADSLIEELIRADTAPRRLTVVSSDHRLQRAARRRRARFVDSDVWYAEVLRRRRRRQRHKKKMAQGKPPVPLLEEDVAYWVRQFGGESALEKLLEEESTRQPPPDEPPCEKPSPGEQVDDLPQRDWGDDLYNPFPPGYGEDLEE